MKRIISLIVTVCFVISSFNNVLFASTNYSNINLSSVFSGNLLPENLGNITFSNIKNSKNIVINIQDLHANSKVQKNINTILKYLSDNNTIKSIYLEGAYGKVDISWLKNLDTKERTEVSNTLLDIGILTGTEFFSINDTHNIPLYGLEDKNIHQDNINRLSLLISDNSFIKEKLLSIKKDLDILNNKFVNYKNRKFTKIIDNYKSKQISTLEFYSTLIKYIDNISKNDNRYNNLVNLTKEDYPNILLLKDLLLTENKINKNNLYKELKLILNEIKGRLSSTQYKEFLTTTNNTTNINELTFFIKQFAIKTNLDLSQNYPNINLIIQCKIAERNINFTKILKEEELLTNNIKAALSYNLNEYEIIFLNDFYAYLEKALTNNLTAKDYDYFISSINKFESLYPKYVVYNQLKDLNKYIEISKQFYKTNNERNNIFLEKIKEDLNSKDTNIIILVTGGYHTYGLKELFSKLNISFITITPQITNLTNKSNIYNNLIIQESKDYSKNALAFTIASQMQDTTFAKTLVAAGLQNKVPFQQIKQIAKNIFNNRVIAEDDNFFTLAIGFEPITIIQQNGYAVLESDIDIVKDETMSKDLSILSQDMDSKDGKLSIKLLLNLLNIINHYQYFDNFTLTKENDILKAIINTLVFMIEKLNIQFSNGFEQEYIEEYVHNEIINNPSRQDNSLDGVDINTARFLPKVIQSILYENDKSEGNIDRRIHQAYTRVDTSYETDYLKDYYKGSLQISGLLASIMKDILTFIESDEKISPELKIFFNNLANISDIANYITIAVFNLADNVKGISLAQGLIGLTTSIKYPMLIECMGHEFAHEMLLRLKEYIDSNDNSLLNKLFAHESHSYLFSILFAQIFNNLISTSFPDTEYRDYNKFLIDLNDLYSSSIRRNLTDKTKSMAKSREIHVPVLNFINMLNRCLGENGNLMSVQDLMTLTETVREVFLMDKFEETHYSTILYTILIEFAKKTNPNSKLILNKYYTQILNTTKLFTTDEPDDNSLLIETFANILLKGTTQQIESFINNKLIAPQIDIQQYKNVIRNLYITRLQISPELYDIVDEIFFTILGTRIVSLNNRILSTETKILVATIINELQAFNNYCNISNIKDKKTAFEKLLKILKEQDNIEFLTDEEISNLFINAFTFIYESSKGRFNVFQTNSADIYKAINEVLPTILKKYNKVLNLEQVINLILNPSVYQGIDITKEILKINTDLEDTLKIITELFIILVKDKNFSFNSDIINSEIKDYAKDKETIVDLPINIFLKLPDFIQEILYNEETTKTTKTLNDFTRDYFISNKNKTNALLKLVLQEIYTLFQYQGFIDLLSIQNTSDLTIFAGYISSGVSNGNFIAINPKDESFLNVIAHELGHVLLTNAGFSHYNSTTIHELFAYTMGLLSTTVYKDSDIATEKLLPVTYENLTDSDEHSLPKTLLQFIIDVKGEPLTEAQLLSILQVCKTILSEDVSKETNIELAYRILELLEQDETFMQGFVPNALTMKFETTIDEPEERKNKILEQLFNVSIPENILIVDKETFIRNSEESPIFIDRKVIDEIFDKDGNVIEGKEQEFRYLTELVRLQVIQQYDLTKEERVIMFERLYLCFKDLENMLKYPPFNKYSITFKKEVNRILLEEQELIYINPEYLKKIDSSKYSEYLTSLIILRSLENKFNKEFNVNAKFDFYVNIDNLDNIQIDLQKFSTSMKPYEYLKQEYDKHTEQQKTIEQAIDKVLTKNKVKNKQLFADKIKNLILIVENSNIDFISIEFFRELSSELNYSTIQQIYENLIEVYSFLIRNKLMAFNSSLATEIKEYVTAEKIDNLDGIEIDTVSQMPLFIQTLLYKNMILEENFKNSPEFMKDSKYKSNKLNGLLNTISEEITNIVTNIYPNLDREILSAQLFFSSLQRLTDGANYGNNKIAISNKLIKRYQKDPNVLVNEILKTISHELGHEELILKGVAGSSNAIDTLHELYAYLFETLLIKAYSKAKGIRETESVFSFGNEQTFIDELIDEIFTLATVIKDFILGRRDEHEQALDILALLQQKQYQDIFPNEKIIETLDIIESFTKGIKFEDDNITKVINVNDLNMQAISFFMLMFMFGGELEITLPNFLALSKALTVFNTELFDPNKVLEAFIRKDTDYMYHLIDEIIVKGNARIKELNEMLFGNKTFEFNNQTYGYSITTNRSENGLLKDGKILIYFNPAEIKFLVTANTRKSKIEAIKRKSNILTTKISKNPDAFVLLQQVNVVDNTGTSVKSIKKLLSAPIQRALSVANFMLDTLKMLTDLLKPSPFKNAKTINVVYYDKYEIIDTRKDILSVYITEQEPYETTFELTEYTINGRALRISYDKKNNFITAYCPQASKQEIIEMTAKYIKSKISSQNSNINLKNIVVDSNVLPDTITYHLSQDNEGFECISTSFMELGIPFIEDLLKLDNIESIMFSKQIYDYIGDISFNQLSKILQDKSLENNQIIVDSDIFLKESISNQTLLKEFLRTTQLKVVVKISFQQEIEKLYNMYGLTDFMLETQKDNITTRDIVEYIHSEGIIQKAPVSYIELTDLTNIEDKLENIPSHQAIVISVNSDSAKDINIGDNLILSSLRTTITKILKAKTISTKTASNMGKLLAKPINISEEEKEKIADRYNSIKNSLTGDNVAQLIRDYPNVFTSEVQSYIEKLFDSGNEEITPAHIAFIDAFLNDILYDDNIEELEITINFDNDIKHYKSILSAA